MVIHCLECGKPFVPSSVNTKIYGPYVEINCPYCSDVYEGKLLNFVDLQTGRSRPLSHHDAIDMQKMAQFIELNSSDYYKKRGLRHGKKKVRNVRD
jgi:DNA-directed RNA polymerase subunit RPC12/RpoP